MPYDGVRNLKEIQKAASANRQVHYLRADENLLYDASATQSDPLDPCLVNDHLALSKPNTGKEKLLTNDINQGVNLVNKEHLLNGTEQDYMEKIRELHERLDMVTLTAMQFTPFSISYE
ncbi:hypothetical protein L2E82_14664 [Cichorium intybus]|uniref:Uncharacterized protein n=1 Tax=Cichorium intybus TaxID=13427 RepID=A0ACB9F186_CICIN|nr:hypothetical protein L2E82_14664 [Cichorium intybus]